MDYSTKTKLAWEKKKKRERENLYCLLSLQFIHRLFPPYIPSRRDGERGGRLALLPELFEALLTVGDIELDVDATA